MAEKGRRYVQSIRAASAEVTRRRILDAATDLLSREPAQGINLDRIARESGVARSTIYVAFESRTGLFRALARDFLDEQRFDRLVAAASHPDAREALLGSLREGLGRTQTHPPRHWCGVVPLVPRHGPRVLRES